MADNRCLLIGCGILKKEVKLLIEKNGWPLDTFFLDSALHIDFDKLSKSLASALARHSGRDIIVFYGSCHPLMEKMLAETKISEPWARIAWRCFWARRVLRKSSRTAPSFSLKNGRGAGMMLSQKHMGKTGKSCGTFSMKTGNTCSVSGPPVRETLKGTLQRCAVWWVYRSGGWMFHWIILNRSCKPR